MKPTLKELLVTEAEALLALVLREQQGVSSPLDSDARRTLLAKHRLGWDESDGMARCACGAEFDWCNLPDESVIRPTEDILSEWEAHVSFLKVWEQRLPSSAAVARGGLESESSGSPESALSAGQEGATAPAANADEVRPPPAPSGPTVEELMPTVYDAEHEACSSWCYAYDVRAALERAVEGPAPTFFGTDGCVVKFSRSEEDDVYAETWLPDGTSVHGHGRCCGHGNDVIGALRCLVGSLADLRDSLNGMEESKLDAGAKRLRDEARSSLLLSGVFSQPAEEQP